METTNTTESTTTFISLLIGAVVSLSTAGRANDRVIANEILNLDSDAGVISKINVLHRNWMNARTYANTQAAITGVEYEGAPVAPEYLLTFTQKLMNKCCTNAKKLHDAQQAKDNDTEEGFHHGYDEAADLTVEYDIPVFDRKHLAEVLLSDRDQLQYLQTILLKRMNYLGPQPPIALYQNSAKNEETGEYEVVSYCNDVESIYSHLDEQRIKMQEMQEQSEVEADVEIETFVQRRQEVASIRSRATA